jgi:uncharacterized protein HemX
MNFISFLNPVGAFFGGIGANIHIISYALIAIIIAGMIFFGYNIVRENAQNQILIQDYKKNEQQFQQIIKDKEKAIVFQQSVIDLNNTVIKNRDDALSQIMTQYSDIVDSSLGSDLNNQAADSLKALIQKLQDAQNEGEKR